MNDPTPVAKIRVKVWNELTSQIYIDEEFEMAQTEAILTVKRMYEKMSATLPNGAGAVDLFEILDQPVSTYALELTLTLPPDDKPGLFERLFKRSIPKPLGPGAG